MIIQVDTREKKNDHVTKFFEEAGIRFVKSKCIVGDYVNLENPLVVVDRKANLQEVAQNLTQDHERFRRECELAKECGIRLIVLVEEEKINRLDKVPTWFNYRTRFSKQAVTGKRLYGIMKTMSERYGVEWRFSTHANYGRKLVEILEGKDEGDRRTLGA